ncbi:MAG: hypothetical protein ABI759_03485 [Candidatus Solibacter sp.]
MYRFALLGLLTALAFAQDDPFKPKAPVEVDKALRERVMEFFGLHVTGEFRKAELLVAEDTKEFFYTRNKPKYLGCELTKIDYTANFTKANVVTICEQYVMMPGFADHPLKVPTPSTWKIENGKWMWYVDQDALLNTPWGRMKPGEFPEKGGSAPPGLPNVPMNAEFLFKQIQLDKNAVSLKVGEKAEIVISNSAPGPMAVSIPPGGQKEIEAKLDRNNLTANGKATLTITPLPGAKSGVVNVQVEQTMQLLPVQVTVVEGPAVASAPATAAVDAPASPAAGKPADVAKEVEFDKKSVRLKVGQKAVIHITNKAAEEISISAAAPGLEKIEAKFQPVKLAAGGKATLTLLAAKGAKSGVLNVLVDPAAPPVPIQVTILK